MTPHATLATLVPPTGRWIDALHSAARLPHAAHDGLFFDGQQLRWLPRRLPGWFRVAANINLTDEARHAVVA
jgi:hypothetical protein